MPGELKSIIVNKNIISHSGETRAITVIGDPGAQFLLTLKNAAGTSKLSSNAPGYVASSNHVDAVIPSSGKYTFNQKLPKVTASDKYKIEIKKRFDTTFKSGFEDYILLNQWYPTTLTLTLASAGSASGYDSHGSNYGVTNVTITNDVTKGVAYSSISASNVTRSSSTLSWEISGASGADITLSRQPIATDFSNNIANISGNTSNTNIKVKALANADGGKVVISDADADLLTTSMVVKEYSKGEDLVKTIEKEIEKTKIEEEKEVVIKADEKISEEAAHVAAKKGGYGSLGEYLDAMKKEAILKEESGIDEKTELEAGATAVKEVTTSAIDTTNNVITLSTSQPVKYGDVLEFTNGGTEVIFKNLKAVQLADSVILITASVQLVSMGVQSVVSTLTLDNFITV